MGEAGTLGICGAVWRASVSIKREEKFYAPNHVPGNMSQLLAQILGKSNWLVVGDVTNKQKPASRVFQRLLQHGKVRFCCVHSIVCSVQDRRNACVAYSNPMFRFFFSDSIRIPLSISHSVRLHRATRTHHRKFPQSVMGLNPRLGAEDASRSGVLRSVDEVSKQLKGQPLDVVDLIIHPSQGIQLVRELHSKVGFQYLFIQPGAESPEIIAFCNKSNIEFVQNCVLRQLPESKL